MNEKVRREGCVHFITLIRVPVGVQMEVFNTVSAPPVGVQGKHQNIDP